MKNQIKLNIKQTHLSFKYDSSYCKYRTFCAFSCRNVFKIISFSRRGRFGVIRECRENATGNLFMAKIVPYEADSKQAVLQEYDILKSLHHDRIMALHEAYVTPRYLVLISEYCSGKELLYSLIDRYDLMQYIVHFCIIHVQVDGVVKKSFYRVS